MYKRKGLKLVSLISMVMLSLFVFTSCEFSGAEPTDATISISEITTIDSSKTTTEEINTSDTTEATTEEATTTAQTTETTTTTTTTTEQSTTTSSTTTSQTTTQSTQPTTTETTTTTTQTSAPVVPSIDVDKLEIYNMSNKQKQAYAQFLDGIVSNRSPIPITCGITISEFSNIFAIMKNSQYSYIQIPNGYTYSYNTSTNVINSIEIEYLYSNDQAKSATTELNNKVNQIVAGITPQMTDFDKIKYFHDTIIKNCEYKETGSKAFTAYGCLVEGQAVCEGYSKAMALLCEQVGIECVPVIGNSHSQPHMWNIIKYNGNWYHIDVTWDDPVGAFSSDFVQYDYFNLTTSQINIDHTISSDNCYSVPSATASEGNYFIKTGAYANDYSEAKSVLDALIDNAAEHKITTLSVRLANQSTYLETHDNLFANSEIMTIISQVNQTASNKIQGISYMTKSTEPCQNVITIFLNY